MTVTAATIRARYPEAFPATWDADDEILGLAIEEAGRRLAALPNTIPATRADDALLLLSAHLARVYQRESGPLSGGGAAVGPIASMSAGQVSVTYASASAWLTTATISDGELGTTTFGRMYLGILRNLVANRLPWDG